LLAAGALFMENLDGTVIATAIPRMAVSFHTAPAALNVGISAYFLTLAVFIPISGWIADRFGARSVFVTAIALFTLSSILCGLSDGLPTFTLMRIAQGIGGAMMVPVGRLIVLRSTAKADLIAAIAYITWPALAAPMLGPPLGGFITTYATWRWIFWLNAPLGVVAIAFAFLLVPNSKADRRTRFDLLGFVTSGAACLSLMYALEQIAAASTAWAQVALSLALCAAMTAVGLRHLFRASAPLLDLRALGVRSFAIVLSAGSLFRMAISATPFLLPLMFQVGYGMNPLRSGLLVLALFAGNLFMKPATTPILRRYDFRSTLIVNGLATSALLLCCAFIGPGTSLWVIVAILFAGGLSRSMQFTCVNTLAFADIPQEWMSGANTLSSMAQQISMGMGVALGALALKVSGGLAVFCGLSEIPAFKFRLAFVFVALLALAAVLDSVRLDRAAGRHLRVAE